ncbi:MAG: hypothetical protein AAF581_16430 [Planctomycetota bacterium]
MRAILAVLAGIIVGSSVNMGLIMIGGVVIPPPEGVDPADIESIKANMHLYEARHFVVPFLAHGLGTLVGAAIAALIAPKNKLRYAFGIGFFFLLGGIAMTFLVPFPKWVMIVDLGCCYIPMAWIGGKMGSGKG